MLSFVAAAILIELTPGPNMTWLAVLGASQGRKAALSAVAGIALGLALAGLVATLGLTVLFNTLPTLLTGLRVAGTLYLLYLAYDAWKDAEAAEEIHERSPRAYFYQGFVSNALNPKAYLFYAAILPQFLSGSEHSLSAITQLSAIYVLIATLIHAGIALLAGSISQWLKTSKQAVIIRRAMALAIAAAAFWFFYSTR